MIVLRPESLLITVSEIKQLRLQRPPSLRQDYWDRLSTVINAGHQIVQIDEGASFVVWSILLSSIRSCLFACPPFPGCPRRPLCVGLSWTHAGQREQPCERMDGKCSLFPGNIHLT